MRKLFSSIVGAFCLCLVVGCSDDDGSDYPSLITDLVVAETNASKKVAKVTLDNGHSFDVEAQGISTEVADTTFRCVASYTLTGGKMEVRNIAQVFSVLPVPGDSLLTAKDGTRKFDTLPRDPMNVVSMWKSGGYINMLLGLMTTGKGTHGFAFSEDSVGHYSLVHLRPTEDAESYTEKVYMSMPIPKGIEKLTFSVYTYDGVFTRMF